MRQLKGEPSTAPREPMAAEKKLDACVRVVGTARNEREGEEVGGMLEAVTSRPLHLKIHQKAI